jgi:hypothetical protein
VQAIILSQNAEKRRQTDKNIGLNESIGGALAHSGA